MREQYDTSGPGAFEGEPPMVRFLVERVMGVSGEDQFVSDGMGSGMALIGKWIVQCDEQGFYTGSKFTSARVAAETFEGAAALYDDGEEE